LFIHQDEAKRATISGRPILSYSRKMLASYILWMDDRVGEHLGYIELEVKDEEVAVQETE
jgi:hypothetical protein